MTDWSEIISECSDLSGKIALLEKFVASDAMQELPRSERAMLRDQLHHMMRYYVLLHARISYFGPGAGVIPDSWDRGVEGVDLPPNGMVVVVGDGNAGS